MFTSIKKSLASSLVIGLVIASSITSASAFAPKETAKYFNGPTVSSITQASAAVSLTQAVLSDMTEEEKQGVYFEYYETQKVCIAIYPTPKACLPIKTELGKTSLTLTNLKPNTEYSVMYKKDNTIRCIATPCPENGFESLSVTFTTLANGKPSTSSGITKNLWYRNYGSQVVVLQNILIKGGYLQSEATGYFGILTLRGVKAFQKDNGVPPTGYVGVLTRAVIDRIATTSDAVVTETFEGIITAFSTACFADGICSITVGDKNVITTIGRAQGPLGEVKGIPDFGAIESKIGSHAKVYAKKIDGGYTLYGNAGYYVEVK